MKAIYLIIKSRIFHKKLLNSLVISLVAISVCILNIALALFNGFEHKILNKIIAFTPQISIASSESPDLSIIKDELIQVLNIKQIQSLLINPNNNTIQGVLLKSAESHLLTRLLDSKTVIQGRYPENNEILIGSKLAEAAEINIGDQIQLITDPASIISLTVSGIFKVGLIDFDSTIAITPDINVMSLAQDSMYVPLSSFYGIWIKDPNKAKLLSQKIISTNPGSNVSNWQDDNKTLVNAITFEKQILFIILSFLIIAASSGITVTQIIQILNQKEQVGILCALGFTSDKLLVLYMLESLLLCLIGITVGILLSLGGIWYLTVNPISLPLEVYHIENLPVKLRIIDTTIISLVTIILTILSSIIPAVYASKLNPIEILRH